jgi:hypothetical protein
MQNPEDGALLVGATVARAIINDTDKFGAPSSTPGSRWECRSITSGTPQKAPFCWGLPGMKMWRQQGSKLRLLIRETVQPAPERRTENRAAFA